MTPDPRTFYTGRLAERRAEIARRLQHHRRLGYGKLAMAACGLVLVWLALAARPAPQSTWLAALSDNLIAWRAARRALQERFRLT